MKIIIVKKRSVDRVQLLDEKKLSIVIANGYILTVIRLYTYYRDVRLIRIVIKIIVYK